MPDATTPDHSFFSDFPKAFATLLSEACCQLIFSLHGPRGGGLPKLTAWQWIMARVYHELARSGNFSANVKTVTRITISDAALSQRAFSIGWKLIDEILPAVLRRLADISRHPGAFHGGYRLLAFDGTRFNLRNTPAINARARKTACRKGAGVPAFAHLLGVVIVEFGHHQPLAAAFGWQGEGELTLTHKILRRLSLTNRCHILADRLFGIPSLKSHLHGRDNLLDAQTPETAAQEVLAMLLAASLIATQREVVAERAGLEILRISFARVLRKTAALCELLAVVGDLIDSGALAEWVERILEDLKTSAVIQKWRPRSCPRTLRQPTKDWPKRKSPVQSHR